MHRPVTTGAAQVPVPLGPATESPRESAEPGWQIVCREPNTCPQVPGITPISKTSDANQSKAERTRARSDDGVKGLCRNSKPVSSTLRSARAPAGCPSLVLIP